MRRLGLPLFSLLLLACGDADGVPLDGGADGGGDGGVVECSEHMTSTYPGCGECRSDMECADLELDGMRAGSFLACFVQGAARQPLPGVQCLPQRECEDATECGADEICFEYMESGCAGPSSRCQTSCDVAACGAEDRCVDGVCRPIPCDEGGTCGENQHCEGSACVNDTCTVDADCAAGPYCVRGVCRSRLGNCLAIARP